MTSRHPPVVPALPEVALHTKWSLVASVVAVAVTAVVLRSSPPGSTAATA